MGCCGLKRWVGGVVVFTGMCGGCLGGVAQEVEDGGSLGRQIRGMVAEPGVARAHWGVVVEGMDGHVIFGLNERQMFQPASNAKLFTTAAAMALLGGETRFTTKVEGRGVFAADGTSLNGDVVLVGGGDANLSGRVIPYVSAKDRAKAAAGEVAPRPLRYLEEMADAVAATGMKVVDGDVVGDDTLFPWEPYPEDWAADDLVWGYGAPISALTVNDNQLVVTVRPGTTVGAAASASVEPGSPAYYTVELSGLSTSPVKSGSYVRVERMRGGRVLRVYGSIAVDAQPDVSEVAIEDPAEFGAMALKEMLEARGVRVTGVARARHALVRDGAGFLGASKALGDELGRAWAKGLESGCAACSMTSIGRPAGWEARTLHERQSNPLTQDITVTNKVSQNLHAELLLHQVGLKVRCNGSTAAGAGAVRGFLTGKVGIDGDDFVFFDGSGLSGHDLVTPRAAARLLVWAAGQPWFADWKASLPVGGEDGSLAARFGKGPLKDRVFAKTGTLGEARALSGYVVGASGRTLVFSVMVGNHAPGTSADREVMDRIVGAIAAAN